MSILAQCPTCRNKQSVKNKKCSCGENLVLARKSRRIAYWVAYRLSNGKQRKEKCGYSYEEAKAADGKRKAQKKENRILDLKPDDKTTFANLSQWFLGLQIVKSKKYYKTLQHNLSSFNSVFGEVQINHVKPADLEEYQAKRKAEGYSDSYIDQHIGAARAVINKAFDNERIGGDALGVFKKVKKLLKKNSNARDVILTKEQFDGLMDKLPVHTRGIVATGFHTGMRKGEILSLVWDKVDLKNRVIRLKASDTKDKEARDIPISDELYKLLKGLLRSEQDKHVFLYRGKPIKDIRGALRKACEKAGVPYGRGVVNGFIFHDTRHSFNTHMRKAGVPESVIMRITGHSTREMFDRYNTIDSGDIAEAVNRLEDFRKRQDG